MVRMPATWSLDAAPPGLHLPGPAVADLLDAATGRATASRMLAFINRLVPVEYLSLVEFRHDVPELVEGSAEHAHGRDVVAECFAIYRRSYFQSDAVMPLANRVGGQPSNQVAALHCHANELPVAGWRNDIYVRERLTGRLSLLHAPAPGAVFGIHLYRDERQGVFQPAHIEQLLAVAPLLRQVHQAALQAAPPAQDRDSRCARAWAALGVRVPALSPRERAVCARIACGMSADGIAADLDIAPSTVLTLRKRAYLKLGDAGLPTNRLALAQLAALPLLPH